MSHSSQYLPFAIGGGSGSPNTITPSAWAALTTLLQNGFQPGTALSEHMNTALRQLSVAVAAIAKLAADYGTADMLDDGSVTNFESKLKAALDLLYIQDLSPFARFDNYTGSPEQSITTNGWQKLPGGLLFQWGKLGITPGGNVASMSLSFPRAFANGCYGVTGTADGPANTGWNPVNVVIRDVNAAGATVIADTGNNGITIASGRSVMWHAWGYDNSI